MMACARASVSAAPLLGLPPTNCTPFSHSNSSVRLEHQLLNCRGAWVLRSQVPYTMSAYCVRGRSSWPAWPVAATAPLPDTALSAALASLSIFLSSRSIHLRAVLLFAAAAAVASTSRMMRLGCLVPGSCCCCWGSKVAVPSMAAASAAAAKADIQTDDLAHAGLASSLLLLTPDVTG